MSLTAVIITAPHSIQVATIDESCVFKWPIAKERGGVKVTASEGASCSSH